MKKTLLAILCIIFVLSLTACGSDKPQGDTPPSGGEEPATSQSEQKDEELVEYGTPRIYQWMEIGDNPNFEFIIPVKNISDAPVYLRTCHYELKDKDGNVIYSEKASDCAPLYIDPGQEGIIYTAAINRSEYDYLNPDYVFEYEATFINPTWEVTKLEVSDIQFYKNLGTTEITGTLSNDTDNEYSFPPVSFLFYDKDGNILCGAYTSGGNDDYEAEDFGTLYPHSSAAFCSHRYWMPNDYPLEDVTVKAFGFGTY